MACTGLFAGETARGRSTVEKPSRSPVGACLPAKGPALLANFHRPLTVAAATVFAGKPVPTHSTGRCRRGFTREHRQSRCHPPRWFLRGHARSPQDDHRPEVLWITCGGLPARRPENHRFRLAPRFDD
ncbi:hypothetical protein DBL05_06465 [Pseudomonas putida]|nr:hypothetical protein DBL05_06465 [Pseudomonas putida]